MRNVFDGVERKKKFVVKSNGVGFQSDRFGVECPIYIQSLYKPAESIDVLRNLISEIVFNWILVSMIKI